MKQRKAVSDMQAISSATKVESQVRDLEASDVKRLNRLDHETSHLKQLFADLTIENEALKEFDRKNSTPAERPKAVTHLAAVPVRRA